MMKYLQKLGKSADASVAALPVAGILMGVGYLLAPGVIRRSGAETAGAAYTVGFLLVKAGGALIDNMAWLFAIALLSACLTITMAPLACWSRCLPDGPCSFSARPLSPPSAAWTPTPRRPGPLTAEGIAFSRLPATASSAFCLPSSAAACTTSSRAPSS